MRLPGNKILRIRGYALAMIFVGMIIMYLGIFFRETAWLMLIFLVIGIIPILLSFVIYFWIGMISARAVTVECPNCGGYTKILGTVDYCQHCKEPLTLDKDLEGEVFDNDMNVKHRREKIKQKLENKKSNE